MSDRTECHHRRARAGQSWNRPFFRGGLAIVSLVLGLNGCQDLTGAQTLPNGTSNPEEIKTAAGAYGLALKATATWQVGLASYLLQSGLLTDELQSNWRGGLATTVSSMTNDLQEILLDARVLTRQTENILYTDLHLIRGTAGQAIGALTKYAGDSSAHRRGALYAFTGYAEVMLAEMFCSGVPLSTMDFERDFTYDSSRTTAQIYAHAIALFDTALSLAGDSLPVVHFAQVGKGRALLGLAQYEAAALAVQDVPSDFVHTERIRTCAVDGFCRNTSDGAWLDFSAVSVGDREGGQTIITPENPRTAGTLLDSNTYGYPRYFPSQYVAGGVSMVQVSSGTEAILIRAEAALKADDIPGWLELLNTLRANSPVTASLPALTDPGATRRADTLFSERAQWLFLSGHRQGDLRRLIRQYPPRSPDRVYPSGRYPGGIVIYGTDVTMPMHKTEQYNPYFRGCLDQRA